MKTKNIIFPDSGEINIILFVLRVAVGWHLLFEGVTKLLTPGWSAASFLMNSQWFFSDFFRWLAMNDGILNIVNTLNMWGLTLIGLGLFLGLFTRVAAASGIIILSMYYLANPPFAGVLQSPGVGGISMIVNLNLIEIIILFLIFFSREHEKYGLDYYKKKFLATFDRKEVKAQPAYVNKEESKRIKRREMLKALASVPVAGAFYYSFARFNGWRSHEVDNMRVNAISGATASPIEFKGINELEGRVPKAKIGNLELSRMIMGGNLIGGWAHARDLLYVNTLVKAYHTEEKVFRTLQMAEDCGMNAIITNPILSPLILKYWKFGGKMQFISDGGWKHLDDIKKSIDMGAAACYVQGGTADALVRDGKIDSIAEGFELIRKNGLPAGIGAHELSTIKACVDYGIKPDFWMKTLHKTNYWSAQIDQERKITTDPEFADNMYCFSPEETIGYMNQLEAPWIAFKILAAGAIHPKDAFKWAFEQGADFICVGMYDFQIVENVNHLCEVLNTKIERMRPWRT